MEDIIIEWFKMTPEITKDVSNLIREEYNQNINQKNKVILLYNLELQPQILRSDIRSDIRPTEAERNHHHHQHEQQQQQLRQPIRTNTNIRVQQQQTQSGVYPNSRRINPQSG
jgi:hypothetical protein